MLMERIIGWGAVSLIALGLGYAFFKLTLDTATLFALGM
jgi:hypothetical protein